MNRKVSYVDSEGGRRNAMSKHYVEFNSSYINYYRDNIELLKKKNKTFKIIIIGLTSFLLLFLFILIK